MVKGRRVKRGNTSRYVAKGGRDKGDVAKGGRDKGDVAGQRDKCDAMKGATRIEGAMRRRWGA